MKMKSAFIEVKKIYFKTRYILTMSFEHKSQKSITITVTFN